LWLLLLLFAFGLKEPPMKFVTPSILTVCRFMKEDPLRCRFGERSFGERSFGDRSAAGDEEEKDLMLLSLVLLLILLLSLLLLVKAMLREEPTNSTDPLAYSSVVINVAPVKDDRYC
jgi:hypothetical protein